MQQQAEEEKKSDDQQPQIPPPPPPKKYSYINNVPLKELVKLFIPITNATTKTKDYLLSTDIHTDDKIYSTIGDLKFYIITNGYYDDDDGNDNTNSQSILRLANDDDDNNTPFNDDSCILRWAYLDNDERGAAQPSTLKEMTLPPFKFVKNSHHHHHPPGREEGGGSNFFVYTLTIDDECRQRMEQSKIYVFSVKVPPAVENTYNMRMLMEYNNTITEIRLILVEYNDKKKNDDDKKPTEQIWGAFVKSTLTENVVHFVPHGLPVCPEEYRLLYDGYSGCCLHAPSIYDKIRKNEQPETNKFFKRELEEGDWKTNTVVTTTAAAASSSSPPNPPRKNIIIVPYTELASQRRDTLLQYCRHLQAPTKYDNNNNTKNNDDNNTPEIFLMADYHKGDYKDLWFKSFDHFERMMMMGPNSSSSFIDNLIIKDDWVLDLYNWSLRGENVKANHLTHIVLFQEDFKNIFNKLEGIYLLSLVPLFYTINCVWDIIIADSSSSNNNKDMGDFNDEVFWSMLDPWLKISIGPYCQFRLWRNEQMRVCQSPIPNFLVNAPPAAVESVTTDSREPTLIIPFIKRNELFYGVIVEKELYCSAHLLAKKLLAEIIIKGKDLDDMFFYSLARRPEGWIRECIRYLVYLRHRDKNPEGLWEGENLSMTRYKDLLSKLLSVTQILNLDLNSKVQDVNAENRLKMFD